jgi:hypothetical protein
MYYLVTAIAVLLTIIGIAAPFFNDGKTGKQ